MFAKIQLGLPLEGPFDYLVPEELKNEIAVGARVEVPFARVRKTVGYVVGLSKKSSVKRVRPISRIIDSTPILDNNMLEFTKQMSRYYCCSWGQVIDASLPGPLRSGRSLRNDFTPTSGTAVSDTGRHGITLIHDPKGEKKWLLYVEKIKNTLSGGKSAILLLPDISEAQKAMNLLTPGIGVKVFLLNREEKEEWLIWQEIKATDTCLVIGTRSSIFAPVNKLGLIIVDEEQDQTYKQEQVPHYHCREAAILRCVIYGADLCLGSTSPSLEAMSLVKNHKAQYIVFPLEGPFPEIKIIGSGYGYKTYKEKSIFSRPLADAIFSTLANSGKILLFLNRKGFSTMTFCHNCGKVLKCPRCNVNLVYYYKENKLHCHFCSFSMDAPLICPSCNSGYIRYSGIGTEKIESETSRMFPSAKIKVVENSMEIKNIQDVDIVISTQAIIRQIEHKFDLVGVLSIDNSLNRVDFRASEKTFFILAGLYRITSAKMVIQTRLGNHHCFKGLDHPSRASFYEEEMRQRKQLDFPPYTHFALVRIRGINEDRVKDAANQVSAELKVRSEKKPIKIVSVCASQPPKKRGKFYWQVMLRAGDPMKISNFLKNTLKDFSYSGIIITVDIDPV